MGGQRPCPPVADQSIRASWSGETRIQHGDLHPPVVPQKRDLLQLPHLDQAHPKQLSAEKLTRDRQTAHGTHIGASTRAAAHLGDVASGHGEIG